MNGHPQPLLLNYKFYYLDIMISVRENLQINQKGGVSKRNTLKA